MHIVCILCFAAEYQHTLFVIFKLFVLNHGQLKLAIVKYTSNCVLFEVASLCSYSATLSVYVRA